MRRSITAFLLTLTALPAAAADLTLVFEGLQPESGPVMVAIYDNAKGFGAAAPDSATIRVAIDRPSSGITLIGVPAATYAVKAFHDRNGDQVLNLGADGRPAEPVAISGQPTEGWPTFDKAAIPVTGAARVALRFH